MIKPELLTLGVRVLQVAGSDAGDQSDEEYRPASDCSDHDGPSDDESSGEWKQILLAKMSRYLISVSVLIRNSSVTSSAALLPAQKAAL